MTVKNEAAVLPRCLQSVADLVDEIVLVDTGSTDETIAIAASYGARIFELPWPEDFALARNAAIERATCDWVLNLDGDEWLDAEGREALTAFLASNPEPVRCKLPICNPGPEGQIDQIYFFDKLFPRRDTIRFVAPIHEFLVDIAPAPTPERVLRAPRIQHAGLSPELVVGRDKLLRNRRILESAVARFPDETHCLYHLAATCLAMGEYETADGHYRRLLSQYPHLPGANHPFFALAVSESMRCLERLNQPAAALDLGLRCEAGATAHPEYWLQRGRLQRRLGQYAEARASFRRCLDFRPTDIEIPYRPDSLGLLPLLQLLALEGLLARHPAQPADHRAEATGQWRETILELLLIRPDGELPGLALNLQILLAGLYTAFPQPLILWKAAGLSAPQAAIEAVLAAFNGDIDALYTLAALDPSPGQDLSAALPALSEALESRQQFLAREALLWIGMLSWARPALGRQLAASLHAAGEPERARLVLLEARLYFPTAPVLSTGLA